VTIAAGLLYDQGVILFADTQFADGNMKTQRPKVGSFACPGGRIGFAMAGAAGFAISAIQKATHKLKTCEPSDVMQELEGILDEEYRRKVYTHPNFHSGFVSYWFVISYWNEAQAKTWLFSTDEVALTASNGKYECRGIGSDLAHYLLKLSIEDELNEREALLVATYTLAKIKENVKDCGGASHLLVMRNDGTFEIRDPFAFERVAKMTFGYEWSARKLLLATTHNGLTDQEFEQYIQMFAANARAIRVAWEQSQMRDPIAEFVWDKFNQKINFPADRSSPESSQAAPSNPQP
jgi:20S proteasome alpha/beta subunit